MTHAASAIMVAPTSVPLVNLSMIEEKLAERLIGRIMKDEEMPRELAERILDQALGYLKLAAEQPGGHFSPSPLVDIGWHTFILYTREYAMFCKKITDGRFIHHEPTDDDSVPNLSQGPYKTAEAMKKAGIVVDEPLWACMHSGDCSGDSGPGCSNCNDGQGCKCGSCNY